MVQLGQKVHSILYGGRDGVVYAIHGEQRPQSTGRIGGMLATGGNADFDIVFTNGTESKRLPECILHGVQWKVYDEVVSADEIRAMREFAASETARKEEEQKKRNEVFFAAVTALRSNPKYKALQQTGRGAEYSKLVAINLRRELKAAFPAVKFTVKMDGHDSVNVGWIDGPTSASVKEITRKYEGGRFDSSADIYESIASPWTSVFGSAKYIFESRKHSVQTLTSAAEEVSKLYGWPQVTVNAQSDGSAFIVANDRIQHDTVYNYIERRYPFEDVAA